MPRLHLDKKDIPTTFDEGKIYYHGGTAIAIEAGLLTSDEIAAANAKMVENVRLSGMPSGSGHFKGSVGVLSRAVADFYAWAKANK